MGWRFEIEEQLDLMNRRRQLQNRPALTLNEVAELTGIQYKSLLNMARNSTLRATNTRFVDALCAFFRCHPSQILVREPPFERAEIDDDEIDRLLERIRQGETPITEYHVNVLYGEEAHRQWREARIRRGQEQ